MVLINDEDDDLDAEIEEKDVDDDIMPVITIEDILNSPFNEIAVDEEYDEENDE